MDEVVQLIVWSVSEWVRTKQEFEGVDLSNLNISWVDVLRGGWKAKPVKRVLWSNPPWGVLKLNFDGSFVHSLRRGGIGGVIRDWFGVVVRNYTGPVDLIDANEAELFAHLIGTRELRRMGCVTVILEGDSFSVIQWCSGKSFFPWRLADWVEEVQDISIHLGTCFNHILRGANVMADALAKEGVFLSSLNFDV